MITSYTIPINAPHSGSSALPYVRRVPARQQERLNLVALARQPKRTKAFMPSTKHEHKYSGCAPNGMRLFPEPPSATLSHHVKVKRDENLRARVMRLREEISGFDLTVFEQVRMGNLRRFVNLLG